MGHEGDPKDGVVERTEPVRLDTSELEDSTRIDGAIATGPGARAKRQLAPVVEATVPMPRSGIPARIGRYTVMDLIGRGGMAEVFLAKQDGPAGFEKQVVIKRALPHLADNPRFIEMFLREARIAARLNHAHVVQIYELGKDGESYFIAMEHVDGITLHRLARRAWRVARPVPMEVSLRAIADAAIGLHHAHDLVGANGRSLGLVHRDISPDNLILSRDGITKVLDFGIAKADDTQTLTGTGEVKGKIPFMSPEQVRGEALDKRTDLYALGVSLYWLLTGERPFDGGSDFLTMSAVCEASPLPPSQKNRRVPPAIDEVVMRLLAKHPGDRLQSGLELHDRLAALIPAGRGVSVAFVRDMMALPDAAVGESPPTTGFLPATPIANPVLSADESARLSDGLAARSRVAFAVAAGAGGVALLATVVAASLLLSANAPRELELAGAPALPPAPVQPEVEAENPVSAQEADEESPVINIRKPVPEEVPPPVINARPSPSSSQPALETPRSRRPQREEEVSVKAPPYIEWRLGKRTLGTGSTTLRVPPGAGNLTALDTRLGGRARVAVGDGAIDYAELPTGTLEVRVVPYAEVLIGGVSLGTTPIAPKKLVIGKYNVTLRYKDQVHRQAIEVLAGKKVVVGKSWPVAPSQ